MTTLWCWLSQFYKTWDLLRQEYTHQVNPSTYCSSSLPKRVSLKSPYPLLTSFLFRAVLGSQKNWEEDTEFSYIPCPSKNALCPDYQHPSPEWYIYYNWGTYTVTSWSPESIAYIRVHCSIQTYNDNIIWSTFAALKIVYSSVLTSHPW